MTILLYLLYAEELNALLLEAVKPLGSVAACVIGRSKPSARGSTQNQNAVDRKSSRLGSALLPQATWFVFTCLMVQDGTVGVLRMSPCWRDSEIRP